MWPVVARPWGFEVRTYAVAVALAFAVGAWLRAREVRRLGLDAAPGHPWIGTGAMLGAIVGSKVGLLAFGPLTVREAALALVDLDLTGKTVYGGLLGGWVGVELAKRAVGLERSTGDGFVASVLVGQAIGRLGCWANGCCPGVGGAPVALWEAALDLTLLAVLRAAVPFGDGRAFRWMIVGYSLVRVGLDPWRADARWMWGPVSALQWWALWVAAAVAAGLLLRRRRSASAPRPPRSPPATPTRSAAPPTT